MPSPYTCWQLLPERGVDLQGFAQHFGANIIHVVPAQVHFSQAGVASQSIDQHRAPRAQSRVNQGQSLQGLEEQRGKKTMKKRFSPKNSTKIKEGEAYRELKRVKCTVTLGAQRSAARQHDFSHSLYELFTILL